MQGPQRVLRELRVSARGWSARRQELSPPAAGSWLCGDVESLGAGSWGIVEPEAQGPQGQSRWLTAPRGGCSLCGVNAPLGVMLPLRRKVLVWTF